MRTAVLAAMAALMSAGAACAEVIETGTQGFRIRSVQQINAPPARVYQAIGELGRWWDDAHTYSGKASNITLPLQAGACWCETLPGGGSVAHGRVILAWPEQNMVRADAALGPLQNEGVSAVLTFLAKPKDGGTELTVAYYVGGARPEGVKLAPAVDGVLNGGWARLKRYVETGKP